MPLSILIAPDKFKGTLTATEGAEAMACGWRKQRSLDSIKLLPMSDGGDGFGMVLGNLLGAEVQNCNTLDAAHRPCKATWWWDAKFQTAIIESAKVIGLAMLPPGKFHPFELDTFGLGEVLEVAQAKGAEQIIIGIGGSATNDGGFGLARALGWRFVDNHDHPIERWTELHKLSVIYPPEFHGAGRATVTVAVDVRNSLLGPRGATRIYGPQKGLCPEDFDLAERCLGRLASVVAQQFENDFASTPGAGAAGGLGFGLLAFMKAKVEPGFDLFAKYARLDAKLCSADLVITGEGTIDDLSFMGKGVGELARRCLKLGKPCIGLGGMVVCSDETKRLFRGLHALTDLTDSNDSKAKPVFWLEQLAGHVAKNLSETHLARFLRD